MTPAKSAWLDLMALALRQREEAALLRTCLLSGVACSEAWQEWLTDGGRTRVVSGGPSPLRAVLALLGYNLARNGIAVDREVQVVLRAAQMQEELRMRAYERILGETLTALPKAAVPLIVMDGAALASTVYPRPALRHCHDIHLVIHPQDLERAVGVLLESGYAQEQPSSLYVTLRHASGMRLWFHTQPFSLPVSEEALSRFWSRSHEVSLAGALARIPSKEDSLVHACDRAATAPPGDRVQRISDAYLIVTSDAGSDWDKVVASCSRFGLALPVAGMLAYLASGFAAPVPESILLRLEEQASAPPARALVSEVARALILEKGMLRALRSAPDWRLRRVLLVCALFPPPSAPGWLQPLVYAAGAVRYLLDGLNRRLRSVRRAKPEST